MCLAVLTGRLLAPLHRKSVRWRKSSLLAFLLTAFFSFALISSKSEQKIFEQAGIQTATDTSLHPPAEQFPQHQLPHRRELTDSDDDTDTHRRRHQRLLASANAAPPSTTTTLAATVRLKGTDDRTDTDTDEDYDNDVNESVRRTYYYPRCDCERDIILSNSVDSISEGNHNLQLSTCDAFATLRGTGQKVVSFSFFGDSTSAYFSGIRKNAEKVAELYPGWTMRVYHNLSVENEVDRVAVCGIVCELEHVDMCHVGSSHSLGDVSGVFGMIWRFLVLGDPTVSTFVVRDLDSLISQREADAVAHWLTSGAAFHAMRDAPMHNALLLGGLWGAHNSHLISSKPRTPSASVLMERILDAGDGLAYKGLDQRLLNEVLGPVVLANADRDDGDEAVVLLAHDSYTCQHFPGSLPWPSERTGSGFVGSPSLLFPGIGVREECPWACRPSGNKDWRFC